MFNIQAWSTEFFNQPTQQMSKELTEIFLKMCMFENAQEHLDVPQIKEQFLYQVIDKRAQHIGLELSEPAKVFLMFQTQSPGTAVMYLYALRSKFTKVNMNALADMFPMGFPTEATLGDLWDKQKGHLNGEDVDNCLDHYKFSDTVNANKP